MVFPYLVGVVLMRFLRRLRLFIRVFAVIGQVQRAFLTTGTNEASDRDERSKGRDQALHGEILEYALIAPEYTDHPAACLCAAIPVWRGFGVFVWMLPTSNKDISYRHR